MKSYNLIIENQIVAVFVIGIIVMIIIANIFIFWFIWYLKKREYELKLNNEKLNANFELQRLNLKNETRVNEMKYFARELHDNLGQITSQLKMYLDFNIRQHKIIDIHSGLELIDKLKNEIRRLSSRYNHFVFDEINLIDSISNDILRISKFSNMMIDLHLPEDEIPLENYKKAEVFRIYQELINNTLNHSKAKNVKILIGSDELTSLQMIIEDDGIGFDSAQMKKGSGLYNIKERAEQIGGSIHFTSKFGDGTVTNLIISKSANEY